MFNLAEYKVKRDKLSDRLTWLGLADKGIVFNKTGSLQQTVELRGHDLSYASHQTKEILIGRLNNLLKDLGSGWSFYFELARKNSIFYPEDKFPDKVSALIDAERRLQFEQEGNSFESIYYLTLVYLPPSERGEQTKNFFLNQKKKSENHGIAVSKFIDETGRIISGLRHIFSYVRPLDDEETLTYLHSCISNRNQKVRRPKIPLYLDALLADTPLTGGFQPKLGDHYIKAITIRFFPDESYPLLLEGLNDLNISFRWVTRWISLDKDEAKKKLKAIATNWGARALSLMGMVASTLNVEVDNKNEDVEAKLKELDAIEARHELESGVVGYGYYTATIILYDQDLEIAKQKCALVEDLLKSLEFTFVVEDNNAVEAWFGALPGHTYANVRYPILSTLNLACLVSLSSVWAGHQRNDHFKKPIGQDSPLFISQTSNNTPFRGIFHQKDVGHTLIVGPTGNGKSTFLVFAALQFLRYKNAKVVFFDKGYSAKVATMGVGGQHYELAAEQGGISLQPLAAIDQFSDRTWAKEWLEALFAQQKLQLNSEQLQELWRALEIVARYPRQSRTLSALKITIQDSDMRNALLPFTGDGPYASLLDCNEDFTNDANWMCFEMEQLLELQGAIGPVLTCIFHKIDRLFTGQPGKIIIDEGWTYLAHPVFRPRINKWLREARKQNVSIWFATQNFMESLDNPLLDVLLESCKTKVFLPNPSAMQEKNREFYSRAGLTEEQILALSQAIEKRDYFYFSEGGCRMMNLELTPITLAFAGQAGKEVAKSVAKLSHLSTTDFANEWLGLQGLSYAREIIQEEL